MKNRIRELRKKHNLTLKELSSRLKETDTNISSDALGKYERGDRNPKIDKWQELADFWCVNSLFTRICRNQYT